VTTVYHQAIRLNDLLRPAPGKQLSLDLPEKTGSTPMEIMTREDAEKPANMGKALVEDFQKKARGRPRKVQDSQDYQNAETVKPVAPAPAPVSMEPQAPVANEDHSENGPLSSAGSPGSSPASIAGPTTSTTSTPAIGGGPAPVRMAAGEDSGEYVTDANGFKVCEPCRCLVATYPTASELPDERKISVTEGNLKGIPAGYYFAKKACPYCEGFGFEPKKKK
jgi:hypothetical protein